MSGTSCRTGAAAVHADAPTAYPDSSEKKQVAPDGWRAELDDPGRGRSTVAIRTYSYKPVRCLLRERSRVRPIITVSPDAYDGLAVPPSPFL